VVGRRLVLAGSLFVCGALVFAGEGIPNWSVPATWSPARTPGRPAALDVTSPLPFVGLAPCRLLDTRGNGFSGAYGPPALVASTSRNFPLSGQCGIPSGAGAVSLNVTVTNTQGAGFILIYPQGGTQPVVSTLNYVAGQTIANAAVVPLGTGGGVSVVAGVSGTDLVVDTNGYYASAAANQANTFTVINSGASAIPAILGQTNSANFNATGVKGVANSPTGVTNGVWGDSLSSSDGATGVFGFAEGTSGVTTGVWGRTVSSSLDARGVYGEALGLNGIGVEGFSSSSSGFGVYSVATMGSASAGFFINSGSNILAHLSFGGRGLSTNGEIFGGSLDIIGSPKNFVSPHPLDPSKEIRYASVEAPTVDVYFRGTAALVNGYAHIEVPEHFRLTARDGTYMTTLTPVGRPISLSVESEGSEGIVVRGSGNARFHYVVYAERAEIEGYEPVARNVHFTPEALDKVQMLKTLPASTKALLVRNGTLNSDGSYNEETARAMGWRIPRPETLEAAPRR
jgi:hypothetical protein